MAQIPQDWHGPLSDSRPGALASMRDVQLQPPERGAGVGLATTCVCEERGDALPHTCSTWVPGIFVHVRSAVHAQGIDSCTTPQPPDEFTSCTPVSSGYSCQPSFAIQSRACSRKSEMTGEKAEAAPCKPTALSFLRRRLERWVPTCWRTRDSPPLWLESRDMAGYLWGSVTAVVGRAALQELTRETA